MNKRSKIEEIMEVLSMIASILMGVAAIYRSYQTIREDVKQLVNRDDGEGS